MQKCLVIILLIIIPFFSYSFANEPINCNSKEANTLILNVYNGLLNRALKETFNMGQINNLDEFINNKEYKAVLAIMPIYLMSHLKVTIVTNKEIIFNKQTNNRVCLAELNARYDEGLWKKYVDKIPKDIFKINPDETIANIANNVWFISRVEYTLAVTREQKSSIKAYDFVGDDMFLVHDEVNESPSLLHLLKDYKSN